MDIYALESFIDFCDNMQIAQEGKILNNVKKFFYHKSENDSSVNTPKQTQPKTEYSPGSIVWAIVKDTTKYNAPGSTYLYNDIIIDDSKSDVITRYIFGLSKEYPSISWETPAIIYMSTKDKKILDTKLNLCQLKINSIHPPRSSCTFNGTATLLSMEKEKTLSEICKECGVLIKLMPDISSKRNAILKKIFKTNVELNKEYVNFPGIHLCTSVKDMIENGVEESELTSFCHSILNPAEDIKIGEWDIYPYWEYLNKQGYNIKTRQDLIEEPKINEFYEICNRIQEELQADLHSLGVKIEEDGDWDSGTYYIQLA